MQTMSPKQEHILDRQYQARTFSWTNFKVIQQEIIITWGIRT